MEAINNFFENKKCVYFICFTIAIYISFIQNRLTENQLKLFKNDYIRIIYLFIIIFVFTKNNIIGVLLLITYLTMSSSLVSEDFYVKEQFFEYTPEQISSLLKEPHNICKDGRHRKICSRINENYKIIENSTKRIIDNCNDLKKPKKMKKPKINFLDEKHNYDLFKINNNKINKNTNSFSDILN